MNLADISSPIKIGELTMRFEQSVRPITIKERLQIEVKSVKKNMKKNSGSCSDEETACYIRGYN